MPGASAGGGDYFFGLSAAVANRLLDFDDEVATAAPAFGSDFVMRAGFLLAAAVFEVPKILGALGVGIVVFLHRCRDVLSGYQVGSHFGFLSVLEPGVNDRIGVGSFVGVPLIARAAGEGR
jgi:hypothetical protein